MYATSFYPPVLEGIEALGKALEEGSGVFLRSS